MVRTKADSVPGTYRKGKNHRANQLISPRPIKPAAGTVTCAVAASAPRKSLGASGSMNAQSGGAQSGTPAKGKYAGGNPVCPRPTPTWQKGIGDFFGGPGRKPEKENLHPNEEDEDDEEAGGSSSSATKAPRKSRPIIEEDDEEAGGSGVTKAPRKSRPIIDDEEEEEE
ncbi:PCNA-associated factor [Pimephales promelas]|nr:PCNA-associated factor [Pimephales promelas]